MIKPVDKKRYVKSNWIFNLNPVSSKKSALGLQSSELQDASIKDEQVARLYHNDKLRDVSRPQDHIDVSKGLANVVNDIYTNLHRIIPAKHTREDLKQVHELNHNMMQLNDTLTGIIESAGRMIAINDAYNKGGIEKEDAKRNIGQFFGIIQDAYNNEARPYMEAMNKHSAVSDARLKHPDFDPSNNYTPPDQRQGSGASGMRQPEFK
jgi:hypothetical protein